MKKNLVLGVLVLFLFGVVSATENSCTETDGGYEIYVRGDIAAIQGMMSYVGSDSCFDAPFDMPDGSIAPEIYRMFSDNGLPMPPFSDETFYFEGDGEYLLESTCETFGETTIYKGVVSYKCPNGCEDGACVEDVEEENETEEEENETNCPTVCPDPSTIQCGEVVSHSCDNVCEDGIFCDDGNETCVNSVCVGDMDDDQDEDDEDQDEDDEDDNGHGNDDGCDLSNPGNSCDNWDSDGNKENETNCPIVKNPTVDFCQNGTIEKEYGDGCLKKYRCEYKTEEKEGETEIISEVASTITIGKLEELGFIIELKEVNGGNETKTIYEAKAEKNGRFLGLFKIKGEVVSEIDSETGEIISTKKPWWAFLAYGI